MTVLATALICSLAAAPANARARTFVASYGNDSNPCTFGSPCKTFQIAVNAVDPGGEVTAIDSAGFGPISITKAVTITSPEGVEAGIVPNSGGAAITVNAGSSDAVFLRGLTLEGASIGSLGIVYNAGGSLTIINCVVKDFGMDGIRLAPSSSTSLDFVIKDTLVSSNNGVGIGYEAVTNATANGVIDHVVATHNQSGISIDLAGATSAAATVAISNSIANNNGGAGITAEIGTSTLTLSIDNVEVTSNATGIVMFDAPKVILGRSVITGNGFGIANQTSPNTFYTYGNNQINLNPNGDISGPALNTTFKPQ
jgi:hypothetical protein